MSNQKKEFLRIANCSGFYGDRLSAAKEMVEGGPIDVLTGDYLAELTTTILFTQRLKSADRGYVGTFVKQLRDVLANCLENNIKIVSNAGGLNPKALAEAIGELAKELSLSPKIAWIDGDDLMPRLSKLQSQGEAFVNMDKNIPLAKAKSKAVTANAYLGCWGIKTALDLGADIVICPRVTDAAVVMGPAAWHFNWQRDDFDCLAGVLAAGHVIECGTQATGGNYSFFEEVPSYKNVGFPYADVYADGSAIISKHDNTGGLVSKGTVTAQLLYEVSSPSYLCPDVIAHFDSLQIEEVGENRVKMSGTKGSPPPTSHKVCVNTLAGYRNSMQLILTGLDIEKKAKLLEETLFDSLGGKEQFDEVDVSLIRSDKPDPKTNEDAFAYLRITVKSSNEKLVGRLFSAKIIELALANYPGFSAVHKPERATPFIIYWPCLVDSKHIVENLHFEGKTHSIEACQSAKNFVNQDKSESNQNLNIDTSDLQDIHLGRLFGTRSGDKGGCANVGIWAKDEKTFAFLDQYLTVEELKRLLPDVKDLEVERYQFSNLYALNFYIRGFLGDGVSSSSKIDPQAKTLGEYLRAQTIQVPSSLLSSLN